MSNSILSSVVRATTILKLFHNKRSELSFMEIVQLTNIPKSSVHRLIHSLKNEGFLTQNPRTNKYRLGLDVLGLGGLVHSQFNLYRESLPLIKDLVEDIGESAHICIIENKEVTYLLRVESHHPDNLITQIGKKNPIHSTSEGLCILAYQSEYVINKALENYLHAYTDKTLTTKTTIKTNLLKVKQNGYCVAEDTYFMGYTGIAAPIKNHMGEVVSSLSIIGRTERIGRQRSDNVAHKISQCAKQISQSLGCFDYT